jgi:hypothetical protein
MNDIGYVDVTGAIVGSTFIIDWTPIRIVPTLKQQELGITDTIGIYNESGCGFTVTFNQSGRSFTLPAGGWAPRLEVGQPGAEDWNITLTVQYVLPNAAVSQVHADYFGPGEANTGNSVVLGNSPVNIGSGTVTATNTSIVNTGNPPGTPIITSSSTAVDSGGFALNNDGSGEWTVLDDGTARGVVDVVAGTASTEAVVTIGDPNDQGMTTLWGSAHGNVLTADNHYNIGPTIGGSYGALETIGPNRGLVIYTPSAGGNPLYTDFRTYNGTTTVHPFGVGSEAGPDGIVQAYVDDTGLLHSKGVNAGSVAIQTTGAVDAATVVATGAISGASLSVTSAADAATLALTGAVTEVNGLTTVGNYGVPTLVSQTVDAGVTVTATTLQSILTYAVPSTPAAGGMYMIQGYIWVNGSVAESILFGVEWTDINFGLLTQYFVPSFPQNAVYSTHIYLDGTGTAFKGLPNATSPITIWAKEGTNIVVQYQNPGGVPNDIVRAKILAL